MGILPSHERWATFLMRLRYVVVDELHTLRGIFGSHVAHVLRRLRRLCEHYGADPTFCFTSATIGNPAELATRAVRRCRSRRSTTTARRRPNACFACWQRPLLDAHSGARGVGQRRDRRAAGALRAPPATRRSRSRAAAAAPSSSRPSTAPLPRRRGRPTRDRASPRTAPATSPTERRELEQRARRAGELGRRRRHQRARARHRRRRARRGGAQRLPRHARVDAPAGRAAPGAPAGRPRRCSSPATTSSTSGTPRIPASCSTARRSARSSTRRTRSCCAPQVACAAHELPLTPDDERWFGDGLDDAVRDARARRPAQAARRQDVLVRRASRRRPASGCAPGRRSSTSSVDDRRAAASIGTVDDARVFSVAHPGAIYLHQGRQYRVDDARHRAPRRDRSSRRRRRRVHPTSRARPTSRSSAEEPSRRSGRGHVAPRHGRP